MPFSSTAVGMALMSVWIASKRWLTLAKFLPRERFLQRHRSPARIELRILSRGEVRRDIRGHEGVSLDRRSDISPECAVGATAAGLGADELRPIRGQVIAIDSRKQQLHAPAARDGGIGLLGLREGVLGDLQCLLELLHLKNELGDRADIDDGELRLRGTAHLRTPRIEITSNHCNFLGCHFRGTFLIEIFWHCGITFGFEGGESALSDARIARPRKRQAASLWARTHARSPSGS